MFSKLVDLNAARFSERRFVLDRSGVFTYSVSSKKISSAAAWLGMRKPERVYFLVPDSADLLFALAACELAGVDACILNYQTQVKDVKSIFNSLGPGLLVTKEFVEIDVSQICLGDWLAESAASNFSLVPPDKKGRVIILTTGTTGLPKAALYTWEILLSQVHGNLSVEPHTWLLVYPLNHFAGYQVLSYALVQGDSIVIPASRSWQDVMEALISGNVDSISATPTFWRFLTGKVPSDEWRRINIKRITLGGEVVTEDILTKLKVLFPEAAITQVYATTELGSCFSVRDGRPGFPSDYLRRPVGNVELKIIDGELFVRSENRMLGYLDPGQKLRIVDGWIATGDLVEIQGDRVYFRGRISEIINVGGAKVHPVKIENLILGIEGVLAVHAYGHPNPITGQVVAVDVEIACGDEGQRIKEQIHEVCRSHLGRHELPRLVRIVSSILTLNEKIVRRNSI